MKCNECPNMEDWIPCAKELPPTWEWVWVTVGGRVEVCMLSHKGYWVDTEEQTYYYDLEDVVAWMPYCTPSPYEGDK